MGRLVTTRSVAAGAVLTAALLIADDAEAISREEILQRFREQAPALIAKHRGEVREQAEAVRARYRGERARVEELAV
jgi:hypothetical protein